MLILMTKEKEKRGKELDRPCPLCALQGEDGGPGTKIGSPYGCTLLGRAHALSFPHGNITEAPPRNGDRHAGSWIDPSTRCPFSNKATIIRGTAMAVPFSYGKGVSKLPGDH